eukprot:350464-Chlamydomonas_euryale.AAC.1
MPLRRLVVAALRCCPDGSPGFYIGTHGGTLVYQDQVAPAPLHPGLPRPSRPRPTSSQFTKTRSPLRIAPAPAPNKTCRSPPRALHFILRLPSSFSCRPLTP